MNPLQATQALGQQIWLDNLSRTLINDGELARLIDEGDISGVTTNPAIFHKAIADGRYYRESLDALRGRITDPEGRYEALVIPDVQAACKLFAPLHAQSAGRAGYVSLEVSPALAHDAEGTLAAGRRLHAAVGCSNLLIKVPATPAGLVAIEHLIAEGISVNVTLIFSLQDCEKVAAAHLAGLRRRAEAGLSLEGIYSVASLFLSRVDTLVDKRLEAIGGEALALRGQSAVAMAKLAYAGWKKQLAGDFAALAARGARPQYLLWASTGTKNPAYSDLLYVEPLIGADTINTLPDATLAAFRDHGQAAARLGDELDAAAAQFAALEALGIDMEEVGRT